MANSLDIDLQAEPEEPQKPRGALREFLTSWLPAILAVLVIRSVLIEPFQIPSGSMIPTLAIGDFIVVSKVGYGLRVPFTDIELAALGEPERGDVVVFIYPPTQSKDPWCPVKRAARVVSFGLFNGPDQDCTTDFIKRIVGLPGDTVELRDSVVYVNGKEMPRSPEGTMDVRDQNCSVDQARMYEEDLEGVKHPVLQATSFLNLHADFGPYTVPPGHYFVLGDNRDNSQDSRFWGTVPRENIKGKAKFVWLSMDSCARSLRWERFGARVE